MQPGDLYQLTDPFSCQYLALRIRDEVLLCGPYLNEMPDKSRIHSLLVANQLDYSQQTALQNYLNFIPICEDLPIFTALQLLFRAVEGPLTHVNYQHFHHLPIAATSLSYPPKEGQTANLQLIENSYALEDKMLAAVARGNAREALEQLSELLRTGSRHVRTGERVRDERNLCFVLGALLRKTAQQAGVHPVFSIRHQVISPVRSNSAGRARKSAACGSAWSELTANWWTGCKTKRIPCWSARL